MDRNEAGCTDLVPYAVVVQGNVVKESLTSIIAQFCDGTKQLLKSIAPISSAMDEVREAERQLESSFVHIKATLDSKVAFMFTDLQREFHVFIEVGKTFLKSCRSMGIFATNEMQLNKIRQELRDKMLDKLKLYLDSLLGYWCMRL